MVDMEVWDELNERRSVPERRGRIRRFTDWKDFALFLTELVGGAVVIAGFIGALLTSLGFKISGSGQAIADLARADTAQIHSIDSVRTKQAILTARMDRIDGQLAFLAYLGCYQAKKQDPSPVLARACARVTANQDP